MQEPEVVDDSSITTFSRHIRSDAYMNSQRLGHYAQVQTRQKSQQREGQLGT